MYAMQRYPKKCTYPKKLFQGSLYRLATCFLTICIDFMVKITHYSSGFVKRFYAYYKIFIEIGFVMAKL